MKILGCDQERSITGADDEGHSRRTIGGARLGRRGVLRTDRRLKHQAEAREAREKRQFHGFTLTRLTGPRRPEVRKGALAM